MINIRKNLIWMLFPLILAIGCARNPATKKIQTRLLSVESERKIGEETKKQVLQEYSVFKSTPVQEYVNRVGQKMASVSDRPSIEYDFTVLDSDIINAFAVPGGFIFVSRGLLENIDDEAELAMVLGHEVGHVAALHGVQMIQKEMGQNALTLLGTIGAAVVAGPEAMIMMANTASLFSSLYLLGYSRDKELEADNLGLQYTLRAGYDPRASLRFLKKLEADEDKNLHGWDLYFRTHPKTSDRIAIIEHMIGQGAANEASSFEKQYQAIKVYLPTVDVKSRGKIIGQEYVNTSHRLRLSVPTNWDLSYERPQSLVTFKTHDKKAEGHLDVIPITSTTTATPEKIAEMFAKNQSFQFGGGHNMLNNAGYGYLGHFLGGSASGQGLDVRMFVTIHFGQAYILWVGAPYEEPEKYVLDLENILRSFRFDYLAMNGADLKNGQ